VNDSTQSERADVPAHTHRPPQALPSPADLVTAAAYLHDPAATGELFLVLYTSVGEMIAVGRRRHSNDSSDIRAVAPFLDKLIEDADAASAHLIAYTRPENAPVLRKVAAAHGARLREVLLVHDERWWNLTSPDPDSPSEGLQIPTDLHAIDSAMIALATALDDSVLQTLHPGSAQALIQVREHLDQLTPSGDDPRLPAGPLFTILDDERRARLSGPIPLVPARAAQLLLALADHTLWERCLLWEDEGAQQLWHDLIRLAPPGWVALVATLIATTAFQQGHRLQAWVAAMHARNDEPNPTAPADEHLAHDVARITQHFLRTGLGEQHFDGFLLGVLWATAPDDLFRLIEEAETLDGQALPGI
jgi:hypothetical protein